MKVFLLLVIVSTAIAVTTAECCPSQVSVGYAARWVKSCRDAVPNGYKVPAPPRANASETDEKATEYLYCKVEGMCHDGNLHSGAYCASGPCNIFGCNCDGICYTGDIEHNFNERWAPYARYIEHLSKKSNKCLSFFSSNPKYQ